MTSDFSEHDSFISDDIISTSEISDINSNKPDFKLNPDNESSIYIFKNGLFTQTLLAIESNKPRKIILSFTS